MYQSKETLSSVVFLGGTVTAYYVTWENGAETFEYGCDWWEQFNAPLLIPLSDVGAGTEIDAIAHGCEQIAKHAIQCRYVVPSMED